MKTAVPLGNISVSIQPNETAKHTFFPLEIKLLYLKIQLFVLTLV